jgi:SAM-dependent methyltransferase
MTCDFQENFWNYLYPATPELLRGTLGLDAGCGFGRHLYQAAGHCSAVVGLDLSQAVDAAHQNTSQLPNVHLVQGDLYALPFAPGTFDVIYSVGVLHHLPDPAAGVKNLAPLLRPEGRLFIWLYSTQRRVMNFFLECLRVVTTRLPYAVLRQVAWVGAAIDQGLFVAPYRWLKRRPRAAGIVERLAPQRIKVYSAYPFQVLHADWFDRLAAPIRHYYDREEARGLMEEAGLSDIQISVTGLYGVRACGARPAHPPGLPS